MRQLWRFWVAPFGAKAALAPKGEGVCPLRPVQYKDRFPRLNITFRDDAHVDRGAHRSLRPAKSLKASVAMIWAAAVVGKLPKPLWAFPVLIQLGDKAPVAFLLWGILGYHWSSC